jgi:ribosomal protein S18 acetylase RimI-like enzyme
MFLQVVGTNDGAQALYKRLGFVEQYRYHYLQP